jgi:hypothetical protein
MTGDGQKHRSKKYLWKDILERMEYDAEIGHSVACRDLDHPTISKTISYDAYGTRLGHSVAVEVGSLSGQVLRFEHMLRQNDTFVWQHTHSNQAVVFGQAPKWMVRFTEMDLDERFDVDLQFARVSWGTDTFV